eukprot:gene10389-11507_t
MKVEAAASFRAPNSNEQVLPTRHLRVRSVPTDVPTKLLPTEDFLEKYSANGAGDNEDDKSFGVLFENDDHDIFEKNFITGFMKLAETGNEITPSADPTHLTITDAPTIITTQSPTLNPTEPPSTQLPTPAPTRGPTTQAATLNPTEPPSTQVPTQGPTRGPTTQAPTLNPTEPPSTLLPTPVPTRGPTTQAATLNPTEPPSTQVPTRGPTTQAPTLNPTQSPTRKPTDVPTRAPTRNPTQVPTRKTTNVPTQAPTRNPTEVPSTQSPTRKATKVPTTQAPTRNPTQVPTRKPTKVPTLTPTRNPTQVPTRKRTNVPTHAPSPAADQLKAIKFNCTFELILIGNFNVPLENADTRAVQQAVAKEAGVDVKYTKYVDYYVIKFTSPSKKTYSLQVDLELPLVDFPVYRGNATALYVNLTQTLQRSVSTGSFLSTLLSEAAAEGATVITAESVVEVDQ